ncbi:MAG: hypothetical protein GX159_09735 [Flavobacteriaceae bacterium]|jgi:hypothetical protein|nr:hypothetical protein [Flavobacteriaceae bacterium]
MNIYKQLENNHSKENSLKIIKYIGKDENRFEELMSCFFIKSKDYRVPQRAAHVVSNCFDQSPELIEPYVPLLIEKLLNPETSNPLKRNILRILRHSEISVDKKAEVYDFVYNLLIDPKEEIAIRAFSMSVLYNLTQDFPELMPELKSTIEFILEKSESSPGIRSRGRLTIIELEKDLAKRGFQ